MEIDRNVGTVKWFNVQKGFGFIRPDGGSATDIFVHAHALAAAGIADLREGDRVEYQIEFDRNKRPHATELRLRDQVTTRTGGDF